MNAPELVHGHSAELDDTDLAAYVCRLEDQLDSEATNRFITITSNRIAALRAEIARADVKANVFIALAAPAIGFTVVTGVLTDLHPAAAIAGWAAVVIALAAVAVLAYALWPSLSQRNGLGALAVHPGCGTVAAHTQTLRTEQREAAAITVAK